MGHQQLLLIALVVILVGFAVVLGNDMFTSNAEDISKDYIIQECMIIAANAQQYFKKPASIGGGGSSFKGWEIPADMDSTINGTYQTTTKMTKGEILFLIGKPLESNYNWQIVVKVLPNDTKVVINEG
jgi:hypothetical protein